MQTFKNAMKATSRDKGTLQIKLTHFLFQYRSTPNTMTGVSPAKLFLNRELHTRLDLLHPSLAIRVGQKQEQQKKYHDTGTKVRQFKLDTPMLAENFRSGQKWLPGKILKCLGPLTYRVKVGQFVWKRHMDQLLPSHIQEQPDQTAMPDTFDDSDLVSGTAPTPEPPTDNTKDGEVTPPTLTPQPSMGTSTADSPSHAPRYPTHSCRPPNRLAPYVNK